LTNNSSLNSNVERAADYKRSCPFAAPKIVSILHPHVGESGNRNLVPYGTFLEKYEISEISSFCNGIKRDISPVKNAISHNVSSGNARWHSCLIAQISIWVHCYKNKLALL
jgi:hypothetical protein